jgi:hypothetical protein
MSDRPGSTSSPPSPSVSVAGSGGGRPGAAFKAVVVHAPQLTTERRHYLEEVFTASLLQALGDADAVRRAHQSKGEAPEAWEQAEARAYGEVAAKLTDKEAAMLALRAHHGASFDIEWPQGG